MPTRTSRLALTLYHGRLRQLSTPVELAMVNKIKAARSESESEFHYRP
jgi:hypothetical protein